MIHFGSISLNSFLSEYWQKKPLLIRQALPNFIPPLSADELAGLALEEEIESRLVFETPHQKPQWHLKKGSFSEKELNSLPPTHWTLLVQGVDRIIPEVYQLLDHFDFLPQWRVDDVMISYAPRHGSVGPHYDNYDVFLFQAQGQREWFLTSKKCTPENHLPELDLRIMAEFETEEQLLLEEGDMLYLPPHIGHYGIARSDQCMTYSFGYRTYQGQEVWDSVGDFLSEHELFKDSYTDPDWSTLKNTSELQASSWQQAQGLMSQLISNEQLMKTWFGCFATRLDRHAEHMLPEALDEEDVPELPEFIAALNNTSGFIRDACCRFAYLTGDKEQLFVNGCEWDVAGVSAQLVHLVANKRFLPIKEIQAYLQQEHNQLFLYELWKLQWIQIDE